MMDAKARNDCIKEIDLLKVAIHFHYNGIRSVLRMFQLFDMACQLITLGFSMKF